MNKCLVSADGDIIANTPLFLCEWNSGDNTEIHTRETLYARYKDTNLYDTDDEYGGWLYKGDYIFFNPLLNELSFNNKNAFNGRFDNEKYTNDNMSIQRIYWGEPNDKR